MDVAVQVGRRDQVPLLRVVDEPRWVAAVRGIDVIAAAAVEEVLGRRGRMAFYNLLSRDALPCIAAHEGTAGDLALRERTKALALDWSYVDGELVGQPDEER